MNVIFEKIIKELLTLANMKPLSKSNLARESVHSQNLHSRNHNQKP